MRARRTGRRSVGILTLCAAAVLAAASLPAGTAHAGTSPSQGPSTAYQVNGAHTGGQTVALAAPFTHVWTKPIVATSYPLIANGLVYVLAKNELSALSLTDGHTVWGPIDVGGTPTGMTADSGKIFVQVSGEMSAYNATTGKPGWSAIIPDQYSFSSYPTAGDGYVYTGGAGSGGTVYAFKQTTGALTWTAGVANGDNSSPTVTPTGVYVDYACNQTYDFAPTTGASIWHYSGPCEGGGGSNTSLYAGKLYAPGFPYSTGLVFNAATGATEGPLDEDDVFPAFTSTGTEVLNESGTLTGENPTNNKVLWSFAGDGSIGSALPVSAAGVVYAATSDGHLYSLSAATGRVSMTKKLAAGLAAPMAVGGGVLIVPTSSGLAAFS